MGLFVNNPTIKNSNVSANGNTNRNPEKKPTVNAIRTFFKGALARQVKTEDLSPDDIIIAIMGPTGSGKSSFINAITGLETGVGHDLESYTSNVHNVRLSIPEMAFDDLVFVDTPGFDDTHQNDVDILKMVADWLQSTYEKKILLSGLLYFHRISDNRMAGTPLKNLRMFEELCGKNAFQNIILTTTMWDEVDKETGENRERELKTEYWRSMLERGSTTSQFLRTRESAFDVIEPLLEAANRKSSVLLQSELVDMRKSLPATAAGQELFSTMGQLVSQREDLLRRIRHEMRRSDGDKIALEPLQEEHQKLRNNLEAVVSEMRKLRLPLGKRLLFMTDKFFSSKFEFLKSLISKGPGRSVADHVSTRAIQGPKEQSQDNTAPNQTSPTGIRLVGDLFGHQPADHPPTDAIPNDSIDCPNQSSPSSTSHTPIANGSNDLSQGTTNQQVQDSLESDQTPPTRTGTISRIPIDRPNQSSPIPTSTPSPCPIANGSNDLPQGQGTTIGTIHSGTTHQQALGNFKLNTMSDQTLPIRTTGAISKDPNNCTHQSSSSSTSHAPSPRPIANFSNYLSQGQGNTSGTVHSGTTNQQAHGNTVSDQTPRTGTFSKDPIDRTHQSPPSSTSHTPSPCLIANGSNDLPQGQGATSGTIHSGTTKQQAQDNTVSDQTTPTCQSPSSTSHTSSPLPITNGSKKISLGQGRTSSTVQSGFSATKQQALETLNRIFTRQGTSLTSPTAGH